ncbi:hypothetical protein AKJ37_02985 [candidate division MSBL1 archaeon SCGC-AAA259I09]|uniref:Restriction endonuclease n=1 Tax=candidate division MSBL1 archaeon SCGC-AAA259I09 TaxID=1698267 RepID=A0A133UTB9_9EURY|nr:hypothetical protein AKJ37_02985 [candidate division MSBL1 archaeon SCGC-AAA259I09]
MIENYRTGRGKVKYGYTKVKDIARYCIKALENSCFVPFDDVLEWFKWSKRAVNKGYITRRSRGKERYDIEAMLDLTKGHMPEEAFRQIAERKGYEVKLDRELYGGTRDTDEGQDVLKFSDDDEGLKEPRLKVQIKDVQWFCLVPENEFEGSRSADIYVGFKTHWRKSDLGQKLFRHFDSEGEVFGEFEPLQGIRVENRGWAYPDDFDYLPSGQTHKGQSFQNDNYYVYWENLRDFDDFPFQDLLLE